MEKFRNALEDLNFPLILLKDVPLKEVLLKPGMSRLRLLQWCLSHIHDTIKDDLVVNDDQLQDALLKVALDWFIKRKEDETVFLGNGNLKKQTEFWNMVFDLVKSLQNAKARKSFSTIRYGEEIDFVPTKVKINLIPVEMQIALASCSSATALLPDSQYSQTPDLYHSMKSELKVEPYMNKTNPATCTDDLEEKVLSARDAFNTLNAVFIGELKPSFPSQPELQELEVENMSCQISQSLNVCNQNYKASRKLTRELTSLERKFEESKVRCGVVMDTKLSNQIAGFNELIK